MGILSRLFGKKNRVEVSGEQNKLSDDITSKIEFGKATKILRFLPESAQKYNNHVLFLKELIKQKLFPSLKVVCLRSSNSLASYEYLIVITGSKSEYLRENKKNSIFDNVAFETFKKVHSGKDPKVMWADGTVKNTPGEGESIQTLDHFNETLNEIKNNYYIIHEVLSKTGQSDKLNEMESKEETKKVDALKSAEGMSFTCGSCNSKFDVSQVPKANVENGVVFYTCPKCDFSGVTRPE
jgi:hypothetical protein